MKNRWCAMMLGCVMAICGASAQGQDAPAQEAKEDAPVVGQYWCYIGTYTKAPNVEMKKLEQDKQLDMTSKGILVAQYDAQTGRLGKYQLATEVHSPTYMALSPNGKVLYAVAEGSPANKTARIFAYSIDLTTGGLTLLNDQETGGGAPCHLDVHSSGKFLCVANYSSGDFVVYSLNPDGSLGHETDRFKGEASKEDQRRQMGPHAHGCYFSGNRVYLCDLGADRVYVKQLDLTTGKFAVDPVAEALDTQAGAGPRHLARIVRDDKEYCFVCNELDTTVSAFAMTPKESFSFGSFFTLWDEYKGHVANSPSLLDGEYLVQYNTPSEVATAKDNRVYVSNRGHDSIALFHFTPDGDQIKMELKQCQPTFGKNPRFIGLDPSGNYMLACNQDSATIFIMSVNPETGELKGDESKPYYAPFPVSLLFVPKGN